MDKTVTHTVGGGGRISRLSVSVVVDYKHVGAVSAVRTPEELKKMQELVAAAVGIDEKRGDQIVVQAIPFDQPSIELHTPTWLEKNAELVRTGVKYGALAFVTLLLLIFVVRPAKRALTEAARGQAQLSSRQAPLALSAGRPDALEISGMQVDSARTVAEIEAEMEAQVTREMTAGPEVMRASTLKRQLVERSKKEPENVAMTIRGWLQENKR